MDLMTNIRALIKQAEEVQAQPNIATEQNIAMAQEQLAINAAALQSGNTVEGQQLESLQKGLATQSAHASGEDQVIELQKAAAVVELVDQGMDFYSAVDAVAGADMELQKEAAYAELLDQGYDFEDAVMLVKAASEGNYYVDGEVEKRAAFEGLLEEGYSFDDALDLVKEASEPTYRDAAGSYIRSLGSSVLGGVAGAIPGSLISVKAPRVGMALASAGSIAGGIHGAISSQRKSLTKAYNRGQEKKAALDELMSEGYSFDDAVEIVKEAGLIDTARKNVSELYQTGRAISRVARDTYKAKGLKAAAGDVRELGGLAVRNHGKTLAGIGGGVAALGGAGYGAKRALSRKGE